MGNVKSSKRKLPEELALSTQERIKLIANIIIEIIDDEQVFKGSSHAAPTG
jgi:hypothetical protein